MIEIDYFVTKLAKEEDKIRYFCKNLSVSQISKIYLFIGKKAVKKYEYNIQIVLINVTLIKKQNTKEQRQFGFFC